MLTAYNRGMTMAVPGWSNADERNGRIRLVAVKLHDIWASRWGRYEKPRREATNDLITLQRTAGFFEAASVCSFH